MKKVILFAAVLFLSACASPVATETSSVVDSLATDSIVVVDSIAVDSVK